MRDDFTEKTKQALAKRVGWRCSFAGCHRPTIGPGSADNSSFVNVGEAAHIYAASPKGPRYNPSMTPEERVDISNGIWMCRHHSRLIDTDFSNYSAVTLKQWKESAENEADRQLKDHRMSILMEPTTLISLNPDLIFQGVWLSAVDEHWTFRLVDFVEGDIHKLKDHAINFTQTSELEKYVVVESQGDGREISNLSWTFKEDHYEIACQILPKAIRLNPYDMGSDLAAGPDFDIFFVEGDLAIVKGLDAAIQSLRITLSSQFGDYKQNPLIGSFLTNYFWKYKSNPTLLNRVIKLELIRLLSVQIFDWLSQTKAPLLNFVNRIVNIEVLDLTHTKSQIPVNISLEWGNGEQWNGEMSLFIGKEGGEPLGHPFLHPFEGLD